MFRGVGTALITPFTDSGSFDEAAYQRFVDWQIEEGINFLVPCGTTGENPALTAGEHQRVVEMTVKTANGRVPVLAGAGSNGTPRAVELAQQAADLGADGLLTITPYYNKPTPDGLLRHFGAQAEAVEKLRPGFPMIMYNVPGRTGLNMSAETTLRMAREIPNIAGVKEASGNMEQILAILRDRPDGFLVLSGDDAWTLPLLAVGADGVVSVASNEVPRLMRELVDNRDVAIHNRLLPLLTGNFLESNPGPVKAALKMMGVLQSDTLRPPLAPLTAASSEKLRTILKDCGLL
ncbi:MAG: 4-hydroxy-tetrahydrodipicolinate synthase [Acidobacteria bacterium]|nr:4-hydroxy-tetrahydrodipicolinate synthase [Acidobacteriota bacterium]MBV9474440.1 4-hydroxy-tetrahydrodipicolinate synthase [Acidobacteriota bacterium]